MYIGPVCCTHINRPLDQAPCHPTAIVINCAFFSHQYSIYTLITQVKKIIYLPRTFFKSRIVWIRPYFIYKCEKKQSWNVKIHLLTESDQTTVKWMICQNLYRNPFKQLYNVFETQNPKHLFNNLSWGIYLSRNLNSAKLGLVLILDKVNVLRYGCRYKEHTSPNTKSSRPIKSEGFYLNSPSQQWFCVWKDKYFRKY